MSGQSPSVELSDLVETKDFKYYTYFCATESQPISIHTPGDLPEEPGVYFFAQNRKILYVGSANGNSTIRTRVLKYAKRKKRARVIHSSLPSLISNCGEHPIKIYAKVICDPIVYWNGLPINQILAIEYGLIGTLPHVLNSRKH